MFLTLILATQNSLAASLEHTGLLCHASSVSASFGQLGRFKSDPMKIIESSRPVEKLSTGSLNKIIAKEVLLIQLDWSDRNAKLCGTLALF